MRWSSIGLLLVVMATGGAARADVPRDARPAKGESPEQSPLDVCAAIVRSARAGEVDGILRRLSSYGRARFGWFERLALSFAKGRIAACDCSSVEFDGDEALVEVENPSEGRTQMPFVRENGYWRFDVKRWQEQRARGEGGL